MVGYYSTYLMLGYFNTQSPHTCSPLYKRMLQVATLSYLRQQGANLREFAKEFKSAAEGLNYNDAALNGLLNYALNEPSSMEGMIIMEHLSFGAFSDFLAHRERQSVPQPIHRMTASPEPLKRVGQRLLRLASSLDDPPLISARAAGISPVDSIPVVLEAMVAVTEPPNFPAAATKAVTEQPALLVSATESAPEPTPVREPTEPAPVQELTESAPEPAPVCEPTEQLQSPLQSGHFSVLVCGASGIRSLKGELCHCPAGVPWPASRCLCMLSTWLVVCCCCMCSPVYCLSPPILLPNHCFSWVCVMFACTAVRCRPACLFFPLGVVFVHFIIKKTHSSCTLSPRLISPNAPRQPPPPWK